MGDLKAVERVLTKEVGIVETNAVLRDAVQRLVLDPEQGHLWIRWQHSDEIQSVPFITRHMKWIELRETVPPLNALFPERE